MPKNVRTVFFWILLIAGVLYVRNVQMATVVQDKAKDANKGRLFAFEPFDVGRIVIKKRNDLLDIVHTDGRWRIVGPVEVAADQEAVDGLLEYVLHQKVLRIIPSGGSLVEYGLDPPELTVDFYTRRWTTPITFAIGYEAPSGDGVYAKVPMVRRVLLVRQSLKAVLDKGVAQLRSRRLLEGVPYDVREIRIEQGGTRLTLLRGEGDSWSIVAPSRVPADTEEVEVFLKAALGATAIHFPENGFDREGVGLEMPDTRVSLWKRDGALSTLAFGKADPERNGIWVRHLERDQSAVIDARYWRGLDFSANDFVNRRIFPGGSEEIVRKTTRIGWRRGGRVEDMSRNALGGWEPRPRLTELLDRAKAHSFVNDLARAKARREVENISEDRLRELFELQVTVGKTVHAVTFYAGTDGFYGKGGRYAGFFEVDKNIVDELDKTPGDFIDRHIFDLRFSEVGSVSVTRGDFRVKVAKRMGEWRVTEPEDMFADGEKVGALVGYLLGLEYLRKYDDTVPSAGGPALAVELENFDGTRRYALSLVRDDMNDTLLVGRLEGGDGPFVLDGDLLTGVLPEQLEDILP